MHYSSIMAPTPGETFAPVSAPSWAPGNYSLDMMELTADFETLPDDVATLLLNYKAFNIGEGFYEDRSSSSDVFNSDARLRTERVLR